MGETQRLNLSGHLEHRTRRPKRPARGSVGSPDQATALIGATSAWVWICLILLMALPVLLATSARPTTLQKVVQAAVFAGIFFSTFPALAMLRNSRVNSGLFVAYGGVAILGAPALTQVYFDLQWFAGDVLLLAVPLLMGIGVYAKASGDPNFADVALRWAAGLLLVAAVLASFFPDPSDSFRFVAPAPILMATFWVWSIAKTGAARWFAIAATTLIGYLTFASQWRSSAVVFLMIGAAALMLLLRGRGRFFFALALAAVAIAVGNASLTVEALGSGSSNRIIRTFQDGGLSNDSSTSFRFVEADAVKETAASEWSPLNIPFGTGHGATYKLSELSVMPRSANFQERNGQDGRVHNIHLGPAMVAYRYGLAGVLAVVFISIYCARRTLSSARQGDQNSLILSLAMIGCIILGVANNVTTQAHFTLTAALFLGIAALGHSQRRRREQRNVQPRFTSSAR